MQRDATDFTGGKAWRAELLGDGSSADRFGFDVGFGGWNLLVAALRSSNTFS